MAQSEADPVEAAAACLARRTGLRLPAGSRTRLHDAVAARAERTTGGDLGRYAAVLDWDPDELDALFDVVSVGQTAFWRHPGLFEALEDGVLPMHAGRGDGVHVVSAGCSTGEEAWTLAACASGRLGAAAYRVTAVDWCRDALATARAGRYRADAVAVPDRYLRWFDNVEHGGVRHVEPGAQLRERVRFVRANLRRPLTRVEPADVVLFCNVGIYFDKDVTEEVVAHLSAILRPGGHLFVGAAESLWGLDHDLELVEVGDVFAYRRPEPAIARRPPPRSAPPRPRRRPDSAVRAREVIASAQAALVRGELEAAADAARVVLAFDEFDVEAHFVVATVADRSGAAGAVEAYRRVLYLDSGFALARACSAPLFESGGQMRRAAAEYRAAAVGLLDAPSRYEPYLESMSAELLADACLRRADRLELEASGRADATPGVVLSRDMSDRVSRDIADGRLGGGASVAGQA